MNRRSFVLGLCAGALGGLRRRSSPGWVFLDRPVDWVLRPGRIVRQPSLLRGQREACCSCGSPGVLHVGPCWETECSVGRTPVLGSAERAYLEYMATHHPQPHPHSETHVLRRLRSGELGVDDVYIQLVSADEIDAPGSPYAGGRGEAFAKCITVLA